MSYVTSRIETVEDFARIATVVTFEKNGGEEAKNLKLVTLVKDGKMTPERAVKLMESFHLAKKRITILKLTLYLLT